MAEMKQLNTRVQLKYDSYTSWTTNNPTLLSGEIAIAKLVDDVTIPVDQQKNAPVLFKVGPGAFNDLPWVSALAADVYTWAKKENPDWTDFPTLPIEVIDNGTGKFVTDVTYADNKITITRDDAVNSLKAEDDDIVILSVDKEKGDVTATAAHKKYNKAGSTSDVSSNATTAGSSVTIKVPTLSIDAYGHTEFNGETEHIITIPGEVAVGDGNITIQAGTGLTGGDTFNVNQDTDQTITVNHQAKPTSGTAQTSTPGSGRTYVTEVLVDNLGHIAGVKTATESDQDLSGYKTKQTAVTDPIANGNATSFIDSISQNTNGEITVTKKTITAADLGLSGAMHFIGSYAKAPTTRKDNSALQAGDVYLNTANHKEYVYDDTSKWVELGDEGSHALKTVSITGTDGLAGGGTLETDRTIYIADDGVTTEKIADNAVTTAKINDDAVTTDKIVDKNVTKAKLSEGVQASLDKADNSVPSEDFRTYEFNIETNGGIRFEFKSLDSDVAVVDKNYWDIRNGEHVEIKEPEDTSGLKIDLTASAKASLASADSAIQPEDLHTIATTGSIYDINEVGSAIGDKEVNNDPVECLIFYCGTATKLV